MAAPAAAHPEALRSPGRSAGLLDVYRWRFLLRLLVRKELRVRYRGSVLGLLWSYVKPGVQLVVFYVAMGKFLGLDRQQPNYIIYLFSGIVMVNYFSEVFSNTTRAIVLNADLVKKIYLPRELFPVSSVWVAMVHLFPQLAVLVLAAVVGGWRPGGLNLLACLGALLITTLAGLGLGLVFGAVNVLFRDAENLVDLILMMATWLSPVLYTWDKAYGVLGGTPLWWVYQANPGTAAIQLAHYGFWLPSQKVTDKYAHHVGLPAVPFHFVWWGLLGLATSVLLVVVGQFVFRRLEGRFAQEL
ncbi:ABC transporter permease [Pedococcus sp. NPDC057267]|uniref:ABC transporter permease n=1 Tax=Pedococcus sp. NPDC057267 TaxID=3346077 RepID=UPI00362D2718